jgi:hypothetical protein
MVDDMLSRQRAVIEFLQKKNVMNMAEVNQKVCVLPEDIQTD